MSRPTQFPASRAGQEYIGPHRQPTFRSILKTTTSSFGIFYAIGAALACKYYIDRKSYDAMHETRLFEASVESGDWKCYHAMRQYHVECSDLDP